MSLFSYDEEYEVVVIGKRMLYKMVSIKIILWCGRLESNWAFKIMKYYTNFIEKGRYQR